METQKILAALDILTTIPRLQTDAAEAYKDVFEQASAAAAQPGDDGRAVREKLYDVMAYTLNGLVNTYAIRALGEALQKTDDPETRREIVAGITGAAGNAPGSVQEVGKAFARLAAREPEAWYGGLSRVFAETAKECKAAALFDAVNAQNWKTAGASRLEQIWRGHTP